MPLVKPSLPILNRGHSLARGLVGAWPMFERSGYTMRDICHRYDATYNVAKTTPPTAWATTPYGPGLNPDGLDDCPRVVRNTDLEPAKVSVAAWFKIDRLTVGGGQGPHQAIAGKRQTISGYDSYLLFVLDGGTLRFSLSDSTPSQSAANDTSLLSTGRWYFGVGTYDGANVKVYRDGVLRGTTASTKTIGYSSMDVRFAGYPTDDTGAVDFPLLGQIADVRIWNRALTAREVATMWADPWGLYLPLCPKLGKPPAGFYSRYYYDMAGGGAACSRT